MNVDTELLRAFVAAAEHLHFARAAEQLHLDPSGVSRQIRTLESRLQVVLFDRTTRSVTLTDAGRAILPFAREAVEAAARFHAAAQSEARASRGELRVGLMTHAVGSATIDAIHRVATEVGFSRVGFVEADFADPSAGLRSGSTDVAVVFAPLSADGLDLMPVCRLDRVAVVRDDHRLAQHRAVTLDDIADEPWIVPHTADRAFYDFWMAVAERAGAGAAPVAVGATCRTAEEGLIAAMSGAGIAIGATVRADFRPAGLALIPITDLAPCEVAVALATTTGDPRMRRFADTLWHRLAA
jgi:DNA-binding transcriptional LysR family regulator